MSDRPLSERVLERCERWGIEHGIFLLDANVEKDWQSQVADEIAALEAENKRLVEAIQSHVDSSGVTECRRTYARLARIARAALEEGGDG